ncbi:MAG: hypothetical protein ACI9BW_001551 [Gammaproteobacteria bacterium]|jgi:hypothetical protein
MSCVPVIRVDIALLCFALLRYHPAVLKAAISEVPTMVRQYDENRRYVKILGQQGQHGMQIGRRIDPLIKRFGCGWMKPIKQTAGVRIDFYRCRFTTN